MERRPFGRMAGKVNGDMNHTQMIWFAIFKQFLTKYGECCRTMGAYGSISQILSTINKARRERPTLLMVLTGASQQVANDKPTHYDSSRSFKHFISGIPHKSEMGVPYRFHLAMTDAEFRRFVGAPKGPQWVCRRTIIWAKSLVALEAQRAEGNAMPEPK